MSIVNFFSKHQRVISLIFGKGIAQAGAGNWEGLSQSIMSFATQSFFGNL